MAGDDGRDPIATLLDLLVFAPIGAALHGPEAVDELASRGRQDVANARVIGKVAVDKGRREASRIGADLQVRVADVIAAAARAAGAPVGGEDAPAASTEDDGADRDDPPPSAEDGPHLSVVPDTAPAVDDLAIPDYDNLAASQVVPRLDDLAGDELQAVQDYERAHRGRMTILSRIAQLQAG